MIEHDAGMARRLTDLKSELAASIERWREQRDAAEPRPPQEDRRAATHQPYAPGTRDPRADASTAALARLIGRDWSQLRESHEAALRELRDHAHTLTRVTIAAANTSTSGMEQAEARLVEMSNSLSAQMSALAEQLAAAASDVRASQSVVPDAPQLPAGSELARPESEPAEVASEFAEVASEPSEVTSEFAEVERSRGMGVRGVAVAAIAAVLLAAGVATWKVWVSARETLARAADSQRQAEAALERTQQALAASRDETSQQLDRLRASMTRGEAIAGVLAAPDLVRYAVSGDGTSGAAGQLLWSRSRGVVLSASRIPPAPDGMTYQVWLQTSVGRAVSLGSFAPDESGRATIVVDPPRSVPPVTGAAVTIEPSGGSAEPSDRVLARSPARSSF